MLTDTDSEIEEVLLLSAIIEDEEKQERKTRVWVHSINETREREGEFHTLHWKLRQHEKRFYIYYRMSIECFDELLETIRDSIKKEYTNYRNPISPEERLCITLRYLATGDTYKTIGHSFRVGFSTVSSIVKEVCTVIWDKLQPVYLPEPTEEMWEASVRDYNILWGFPNCLGAIDGKHVTIKCPKNSGSDHFSYLKKFSIVLMAIVDPHYKFITIDVGAYGKNSDGRIFEESAVGRRLEQRTLNVPANRPLPGCQELLPCVLIEDEAFALSPYLMRPFPYRQSRDDLRLTNYNKRLCRARRVVENAFGILAQKWRIFRRPIEAKRSTLTITVKAVCVLHNYLRSNSRNVHYDNTLLAPTNEQPNAFTAMQNVNHRSSNYAFNIREQYVRYFNP